MRIVSGPAAHSHRPETRVLRHYARRSHARKQRTACAIHPPASNEVHRKESERWPEHDGSDSRSLPFLEAILRPPFAVSPELLEPRVERCVRLVRERRLQFPNRSIHFDVLVHSVRVVSEARPEKTNRAIALPPAMPHFCTEEIVPARNAIRIEARLRNHSRYFRAQCIRSPLVRVDDKNPRRCRLLDRGVALQSNRRERIGQNLSAAVSRERRCVVGRTIFDDDDLASPANAADARSDVVRFVACSNYNRDANCRLVARG